MSNISNNEQLKQEIKKELVTAEKTTEEISEKTGISISTLQLWKKEVLEGEKNNDKQEEKLTEVKKVKKEIKKLIGLKKLDSAYELAEKYPNEPIIQSQKMKILRMQRKLEEAKVIGNREEFKKYAPIQTQMMIIAIEEGDLEKAKKIGNKEEFKNDGRIQAQMLKIAIEENDIEKAKEIGSREKFKNDPIVQIQMMKIAIEENDIEKAKEIGSREEFRDNVPIQSKMITLAIKENDFKKIKEIGNQKELRDNKSIQTQLATALVKEKNNVKENKKKIRNMAKTEIYFNKPLENIVQMMEESECFSEYTKTLILLAACDKNNNTKYAKKFSSNFKTNNPDNQKQIKTINRIMERIISKKSKIFDLGYYDDLIRWEFDEELYERYEKERQQENVKIIKKVERAENLHTDRNKEIEEKQENFIQKRLKKQQYVNSQSKQKIEHKNKTNNAKRKEFVKGIEVKQEQKIVPVSLENNEEKDRKNKLNSINNFIQQQKPNLYVNMQKADTSRKAIEQWDKLEDLVKKLNSPDIGEAVIDKIYNKVKTLKKREEKNR